MIQRRWWVPNFGGFWQFRVVRNKSGKGDLEHADARVFGTRPTPADKAALVGPAKPEICAETKLQDEQKAPVGTITSSAPVMVLDRKGGIGIYVSTTTTSAGQKLVGVAVDYWPDDPPADRPKEK